MRALVLLLPPLLLAACTSASGRAVSRAEAASARGDRLEAAHAWAEACALAPEACPRAAEAREAAVAQVAANASAPCLGGDTPACVERLRPGRALAPADERLLSLAEAAGRNQLDRCGDGAALDERLQALACGERWRTGLDHPAYDAALAARRAELAEALASIRGGPGARALLLGAAACLDGSGARREAAATAAAAFEAAAALPLSVSWRVEGAPALLGCDQLVAGRPLRCAAGGQVLAIEGRLEPVREERRAELREVEWVAERRQLPNPAWEVASHRVLAAEQALQALEVDAALAADTCRAAERALNDAGRCLDCKERHRRDATCDHADTLERARWDRSRALDAARGELGRTQPWTESVTHARGAVEETHHTWTAPWQAVVRLGDRERPLSGAARHVDLGHPALPAAGIRAKAPAPPPAGFGQAHLAAGLQAAAAALLDEALARAAAARAADCPLPVRLEDGWLACRAEATRWGGRPADGGELLAALAGAPIACR